jgi:hypothetical protein
LVLDAPDLIPFCHAALAFGTPAIDPSALRYYLGSMEQSAPVEGVCLSFSLLILREDKRRASRAASLHH